MKTALLVAALVCALVVTALGFDVFSSSQPHLFGWTGAALALYFASKLVP